MRDEETRRGVVDAEYAVGGSNENFGCLTASKSRKRAHPANMEADSVSRRAEDNAPSVPIIAISLLKCAEASEHRAYMVSFPAIEQCSIQFKAMKKDFSLCRGRWLCRGRGI